MKNIYYQITFTPASGWGQGEAITEVKAETVNGKGNAFESQKSHGNLDAVQVSLIYHITIMVL